MSTNWRGAIDALLGEDSAEKRLIREIANAHGGRRNGDADTMQHMVEEPVLIKNSDLKVTGLERLENKHASVSGNLRIVCISGTHGLHHRLSLPDGDILIHAGDFMVHGRSVSEIDDFSGWLGGLSHKHRIVVAGNHDLLFESSSVEARARLTNAIYLENTGTIVNGIRFWGCPVTPVLSHMAFAVERGTWSGKQEVWGPDSGGHWCSHYSRHAVWDAG